ncbi:MAG: hypothetical protein HKN37_03310 [Rhodothermales bacterium]|nr:hypothetical protein [Rhodothermales bacterium]
MLKAIFNRRYVPHTIAVLLVVVSLLVIAIPPEARLGSIIRIVLLHGALARAGLVIFAVAGVLGIGLLIRPGDRLGSWTVATQQTAFAVWLAAALTSTVATYLSWGMFIAWAEPRTQGTAKILVLCLVLLLLVLWIKQHRFTGLVNAVLAVFAWLTVMQATSVQHPENPVGSSPSIVFQVIFVALVGVLILTALQFTRWIHRPRSVSTAV